jgi:tetratricopeptide (TPR) repeat protein
MTAELAHQRPGRPSQEVTALLARAHAPAMPTTDAAPDTDRLDAVLDLSPDSGGPAYAETAITLCLVRALAHIATPASVAAFAPVALDARGAFAPDVHRYLADLGERATAGLVLMSHSRAPAAEKWASAELEAFGKRTPGDAIQTKSKEVLADVLLAYGAVEDADALPVVMSFINADRRLVRDAARDSLAQYGELAMPKLRETYGLLVGEAPPPDWALPWLRKKLFEALDRIRLEDVDARVHAGLALAEEGRFADAVADFDDVLARQPDWDRKAELVPAYVFYAQSVVEPDPKHAKDLLDKALHLDPSGPRAPQIQSSLAVLEGQELARRGIVDEEPFRRALLLDPGNAAASRAILRMEDDERARKKAWDQRFLASGGVLALVSVLILFVGRGRRRRR